MTGARRALSCALALGAALVLLGGCGVYGPPERSRPLPPAGAPAPAPDSADDEDEREPRSGGPQS